MHSKPDKPIVNDTIPEKRIIKKLMTTESGRVRHFLLFTGKSDVDAVINYIDKNSDCELINLRADLKECIGAYSGNSGYWSFLSVFIAIAVLILPRLLEGKEFYVDIACVVIAVFTIPFYVVMFLSVRPHRIGQYYRALSLLEDCCQMRGRLQGKEDS